MIVFQWYWTTFRQWFDFLQKRRVKWKLPWKYEKENDADTESVYFVIVIFSIIDFWGNKTWSSCKFFLDGKVFDFIFEDSKSKVDEFDPEDHFFIFSHFDQHILRFQVPVNDSKFFIEIDNGVYKLLYDDGSLILL